MGAFQGEHSDVSQCAVYGLGQAVSAELMSTALQSVRSMGLFAADTADVSIDHFFFGNG
jgi:hypothetical protein